VSLFPCTGTIPAQNCLAPPDKQKAPHALPAGPPMPVPPGPHPRLIPATQPRQFAKTNLQLCARPGRL